MERKVLNIGGQEYIFRLGTFEDDIDVEKLLKIDYSNLIGELCTFSLVVNKLGLMLAETESKVSEIKLNSEIFEAKLKEKLRVNLAEANGGKAPTVDALNSAVTMDKGYQAIQRSLIEAKKNRDYLLTMYLAAKDKSEKLNKLSLQIQPGDIDASMLEGEINGIVIKKNKSKKLID